MAIELKGEIPLITIQVTPDVGSKIRFMAESGVFAIKTGNVSLNFHEGVLKSIKTEIFTYATVDNLHTNSILTVTA